jgi:hypothetical protein
MPPFVKMIALFAQFPTRRMNLIHPFLDSASLIGPG